MKWFKHDSNANTDAKLRKLRLKYGMEGYGLYWYCLELIAQNVEKHNLTFELEHDAEIIAADTNIHVERVQEMMTAMLNLGLFENSDGAITCLKMAVRSDEYTQQLIRKAGILPMLSGHSPDTLPIKSEVLEQKRTEEIRTDKQKHGASRHRQFIKPTLEEVTAYCKERGNDVSPNRFLNHYESNGWKVGRNPMRDWRAAVRTWESPDKGGNRAEHQQPGKPSLAERATAARKEFERRATAGEPVGTDGAHLRAPLDGRIRGAGSGS